MAGEVAKNVKHLAMVEKVEGDFILLCVECFGVWSPFALSTFNSIADRMTTRSGITQKLARKNILQQLSVSLWMKNARMILRYWALQCDDNDLLFSPVVVV